MPTKPTTFGMLVKLSGMSHSEISKFLKLSRGTVSVYCYTDGHASKVHVNNMRKLIALQERYAQDLYTDIMNTAVNMKDRKVKIPIPYAENNSDAWHFDFPCASAFNTAVSRTLSKLPKSLIDQSVLVPAYKLKQN